MASAPSPSRRLPSRPLPSATASDARGFRTRVECSHARATPGASAPRLSIPPLSRDGRRTSRASRASRRLRPRPPHPPDAPPPRPSVLLAARPTLSERIDQSFHAADSRLSAAAGRWSEPIAPPPPAAVLDPNSLPHAAARRSAGWLGWGAVGAARGAVLCAAFFTCVVFPCQLAFDGEVRFATRPRWAALYALLDGLLWLEMAARFVTPGYRLGRVVYSHRAVARDYICGRADGLLVDVLSRFPWDAAAGSSGFSYGHLARLLLLRRALVVLRTRVRGSPRFLPPSLRLLLLLGTALLALHWYTCLLFLASRRLDHPDSWLASVPWSEWPAWARYLHSFDRALLIVTGEGVRGETHEEIAISCVGLLVGTASIAYFTSKLVSIVASVNEAVEAAHTNITRAAEYLTQSRLPPPLQRRVREHLQAVLLEKRLVLTPQQLLCELSPPLRSEVDLERCTPLLRSPTFSSLLADERGAYDPHFLKLLVRQLQLAAFAPADFVVEEGESDHNFFFLCDGVLVVVVGGKPITILHPGACFGEIALLIAGARRAATIVAHSFSTAQFLTRDALFSCLRDFPELKLRITRLAESRLRDLTKSVEHAAGAVGGADAESGRSASAELDRKMQGLALGCSQFAKAVARAPRQAH
ncbi:hypothetical protein AB1Y20_002527 [Prymnesium parvum]|uniref:Cyclic nucleotide-binding domain-containing protein n=1 Tax=Prymnesium parvum TaxID=97485 RepID=A0AB34JBC5_PRYPA